MKDNYNQTYNLYLISDATGETLISLGRAVSAQYIENFKPIEHIYTMIRDFAHIDAIMKDVQKNNGIVIYTIVDIEISNYLEYKCSEINIPCKSVLDPIMEAFADYLNIRPNRIASAQHVLDEEYFKRQDAINYSLTHDDGQMPKSLNEAEIIILGISRTSKTPTSIYLANRGIKTANIPIILGIELPVEIFFLKNAFIVGLLADENRIQIIRKNRPLGNDFVNEKYSDLSLIKKELDYARNIFIKNNIPIIDVTNRAVEETAAEILKIRSDFAKKA